MAMSWFKQSSLKLKQIPGKWARRAIGEGHRRRSVPVVEPLDSRVMLAVTASFSAAGGELRVVGDDLDNTIVVSRTVGGTILVNNGAVAIQGDVPTIANTNHIHIV